MTPTCVAPRHIDAPHDFSILIFSERAAPGGEGEGGLEDFFFLFFFPVQQTTSGIGHRVK